MKDEKKDPTENMPISIPLSRARLCIDCEVVWPANGRTTCPSCGSSAYWSMGGKLLTGETEEKL